MKTNKQTILKEIYDDINLINWSSENVKNKALYFVSNFLDNSFYKFKSLLEPQHLTQKYWSKVIPGKTDHMKEIKSSLIKNEILNEFTGLYLKDKRVKSYIINSKYINTNFHHIIIADPFYNALEDNELQEIEIYTKTILNEIQIIKGSIVSEKGSIVSEKGSIVSEMINTVKEITETENPNQFIDVKINEIKYRYRLDNAIKFTKENNYKLISYGKKKTKYYFIKDIESWKELKAIDLSIYYTRQLFNIENNITYAKRNDTNNRLDTNLTNLKSDLWKYLTLDNEELLEIDIINAQFAILSHLMKVDDNFYELTITGKLYEYIAEKLNCTRSEAKSKMFMVAFDKIQDYQDEIRELFPKTMEQIDGYKRTHGYKTFSNLLQNNESNIMIDNVLFKLMKNYKVVTVHDSVRVKKSDYNNVLKEIKEIFKGLDFKCTLKDKTNTEEQKAINTESNIVSNINVQELKEDVQTKPEIDYKLKTQLKETIVIKLTDMFNYTMVSNLQFRPILNKIIDESYDLVIQGKKLNKTILKEMIIKYK